jgi:cellulase/cellobiase CelA1
MPQYNASTLTATIFSSKSPSTASRASSRLSTIDLEQFDDYETLIPSPSNPISPTSTSTSSSNRKPGTSWIFQHMPDKDPETVYRNCITNKEEWRCKYCTKTYTLSGGTSALTAHLVAVVLKGHGIQLNSP